MRFLLNTEQVSFNTLKKALEVAITSCKDETVKFLWSKTRAPSDTNNKGFKATRSFKMVKLLYENQNVSSASIIAAFKKAAGSGRRLFFCYEVNAIEILKLLYTDTCIPAKVLGEALVIAARNGQRELVELMQDDFRITAEMRCDALQATATTEANGLMKLLYRIGTPSEVIWDAFKQASICRLFANVEDLLTSSWIDENTSQKLKNKILLHTVRFRRHEILRLLNRIERDWPHDVLEKALEIARTDEVKTLLHKLYK